MLVNVEVAGEAAHVMIEVIGCENSGAENLSHTNWLMCRVEVWVRGFRRSRRCIVHGAGLRRVQGVARPCYG